MNRSLDKARLEFSILPQACAPARNIHWAYQPGGGQDGFGDWVVEPTYGRIGSKG